MTRKMIAALQISLDGYTQGSDQGGVDWVDSWADAIELVPDVDTFVQGAGMYPGYGMYWSAIEAHPHQAPPFQERAPTKREVAYARFAAQTPHFVPSTKLDGVAWPPTAQVVGSVADLRALKERPGKNIYVVGGPTLVTSLLNEGLLDELKLIVHPLLLASGRPLFEKLAGQHSLTCMAAEPITSGKVILSYRV